LLYLYCPLCFCHRAYIYRICNTAFKYRHAAVRIAPLRLLHCNFTLPRRTPLPPRALVVAVIMARVCARLRRRWCAKRCRRCRIAGPTRLPLPLPVPARILIPACLRILTPFAFCAARLRLKTYNACTYMLPSYRFRLFTYRQHYSLRHAMPRRSACAHRLPLRTPPRRDSVTGAYARTRIRLHRACSRLPVSTAQA